MNRFIYAYRQDTIKDGAVIAAPITRATVRCFSLQRLGITIAMCPNIEGRGMLTDMTVMTAKAMVMVMATDVAMAEVIRGNASFY